MDWAHRGVPDEKMEMAIDCNVPQGNLGSVGSGSPIKGQLRTVQYWGHYGLFGSMLALLGLQPGLNYGLFGPARVHVGLVESPTPL